MANYIHAGRICGNPLNGLCEKVCIRVKRVFNGCISRLTNQVFTIPLTNISPIGAVLPYTYVRAYSSGEATVENNVNTPISGGETRVRYDAVLPLTEIFTDANGGTYTAESELTIDRDLILGTPTDGTPYSVDISARLLSGVGTISADGTTATITCCVAIITRIIIDEDIVIPEYGECVYPPCRPYEDVACLAVFNTPPYNQSN